MDSFIANSIQMLFDSIDFISSVYISVVGEFGSLLIVGTIITFLVYRLLIKPITGYGAASDSARPKKDEKGE